MKSFVASMFQKQYWLLWGIFALALFVRLYQLGAVPHALHDDEVTNAYVGRFILQNGKDLRGNILPLFYFDKFGDFPPVVPMYIAGAATFLFGTSAFGARFAAALLGSAIVFPIFWIGRMLFVDRKFTHVAAVLVALLPWHIVLSRASSEGIMGLTVFCVGLGFIFKGLLGKQSRPIIIGTACLLFTYLLYPAFRLFVPLAFIPLPFIFPHKIYRKILISSLVIAIVMTVVISFTPWGKGRFAQTSLLADKQIAAGVNATNTAMANDEGPHDIVLARIFHNKAVGYTREFMVQYLSYFSPNYLFLHGGLPDRYVVPLSGLVYLTWAVFLVSALLPLSKKTSVRSDIYMYVLILLFLAPLPAALTVDDAPNIHRSIIMIPSLILLLTYGSHQLYELLLSLPRWFRVAIYGILLVSFVVESAFFAHQYLRHMATYKSIFRKDGNVGLVTYLIAHKDEYAKIYMPPFHFLPVYYLYFSHNFSGALAGKFYSILYLKSVDTIEFIPEDCPSKFVKKDQLLAGSLIVDMPGCESGPAFEQVASITRADHSQAYRLVKYVPQ